MPPRLTEEQRRAVTAALFRQEPYPHIAATHGVSERRLRGIARCLRTYGTTHPPRTKPMGRPKIISDEVQESLREFVNSRPLANLEDMQSHIQDASGKKCSIRAISRRLSDMGYVRTIVQRGNRSLEKDKLPDLSESDRLRLQNDPAAADLLDKPKVIYAWLLTTKPTRGPGVSKPKSSSTRKGKSSVNPGRAAQELSEDEQDDEGSFDGMFDADGTAATLLSNAVANHPPAPSQAMG
ncbi:hypothetical protein AJ79_08734 [Helicocarpus griseus UAMH5409]|uniref:Uncharacterized protein n=1 Tax=Helicocarpus griseus UAMH5409 TaxID=1447875 RepID=A0A2B7WQV7_9EURO|nr:hypothetical protein AJ79_08734 [Helicocarpus griseus UAMH5409]